MNFKEKRKYMLKNPPKGVASGSWVKRTADYYNRTVTKGKKYQVRNYFRYLNYYGIKGDKDLIWDEFITIKNDNEWTVKMNLLGFTPCATPLSKIQELENRIIILEESKTKIQPVKLKHL
jgi:hypothetical protein